MQWITELSDWWADLPAEWAWLMLLPFFVVAVALVADAATRRQPRAADTAAPRRHGIRRHARRRA